MHVESIWLPFYKWCLLWTKIILDVSLTRFYLLLPFFFFFEGRWGHELWVSQKIGPLHLFVLVNECVHTYATCIHRLRCCVCTGSQLFCCLNHRACCLDVLSVLVSALWNKVQNIKEITRNILVARIVIVPEGEKRVVISLFYKCPGKSPQLLLNKTCNGALLKGIFLNFVSEVFWLSWREK